MFYHAYDKATQDTGTGCLEPVSVTKFKIVSVHNYFKCTDQWFSTDGGS
jgi:hypothetical protein